MGTFHKMSRWEDGLEVEHVHATVFARRPAAPDLERIVAGMSHDGADVFYSLAACLAEPFFLLYVLHTPRGEAEAGRYQSPELSRDDLRRFLTRFDTLLVADARFDLWVHSPQSNATVVWDRHDLVYAYGPLGDYERVLRARGFVEGGPDVPSPHVHHYRAECDNDARALLSAFRWIHSPLRPGDEQ